LHLVRVGDQPAAAVRRLKIPRLLLRSKVCSARIVGFREPTLFCLLRPDNPAEPSGKTILHAPEHLPERGKARLKSILISARGPMEATLACFQMLSQHLGMLLRRDVLKRTSPTFDRNGISLQLCGAMAELMGLNSQLVNVPCTRRQSCSVSSLRQDSFALLQSKKRTGFSRT